MYAAVRSPSQNSIGTLYPAIHRFCCPVRCQEIDCRSTEKKQSIRTIHHSEVHNSNSFQWHFRWSIKQTEESAFECLWRGSPFACNGVRFVLATRGRVLTDTIENGSCVQEPGHLQSDFTVDLSCTSSNTPALTKSVTNSLNHGDVRSLRSLQCRYQCEPTV